MKYYSLLLLVLVQFLFLSCSTQENLNKEIPEKCYDNASLVWSVDGLRNFDDTQLHARPYENWNEFYEVHVNGAWRISLNSDDYEIYIEGNPFFTDKELDELSKEEWMKNFKIRGSYSFQNGHVNKNTLSLLKKEEASSRLHLQQAVNGQIQLSLENQNDDCEYIVVNINALFTDNSNNTQQVELNLKTPYSYPK